MNKQITWKCLNEEIDKKIIELCERKDVNNIFYIFFVSFISACFREVHRVKNWNKAFTRRRENNSNWYYMNSWWWLYLFSRHRRLLLLLFFLFYVVFILVLLLLFVSTDKWYKYKEIERNRKSEKERRGKNRK